MVRLKDLWNKILSKVSKFQFHYGSVKSSKLLVCTFSHRNFNSTMVRLKDAVALHLPPRWLNFNSTMVRLKGTEATGERPTVQNFNSTMVRLKVEYNSWWWTYEL